MAKRESKRKEKTQEERVGYPPDKLKEFEDMLLKLRQRILEGVAEQQAEIDGFKGDTESDTYDDASNIAELNILMALSDSQKRELDQIGIAMAKIRDGSYGVCEECTQLIGEARLKALPFASLCVECKGKEERGTVVVQRDNRSVPVDEEFLRRDDDEDF